MGLPTVPFLLPLFFALTCPLTSCQNAEHRALMAIKSSLDPHASFLSSWTLSADPCDGSFDGVACNEHRQVTNISLQGKGLSGEISAAMAELKNLTGLYLHFNSLRGGIPKKFAGLTQLTDLYLNVNNLSGSIPPEIGNLSNLQVMELCCNQLSGSIPKPLGSLQKLSVLSLQHNQLTGAIPASLGDLGMLTRLDLSFNGLLGPIPRKLANSPGLQVLDVQNNTLSGTVPLALKRLGSGFLYAHNPGLCGVGFSILKTCAAASDNSSFNKPEPIEDDANGLLAKPANLHSNCGNGHCSNPSKKPQLAAIFGVIGALVVSTFIGLFTFSWYRRRKQKLGASLDASGDPFGTDRVKAVCRKISSPLSSLEYSNGWDPMSTSQTGNGFSQEVLESFMFNVDDVERATQCFSEGNLLSKGSFSAIYKGILRDGSVVVVKCIAKTCCNSNEAEFLKGLGTLASLKHGNLVRLRGFCCSKGRGECLLIYDFVPNGNLLQHLDLKPGSDLILDWSTRFSIIFGIAKGIAHLHGSSGNNLALVHQNLSAKKVLLDWQLNPLLSDSGLHRLLADDIVFSTLKFCAANGYLAPEYTTTGRFTAKSDVYAYGMIAFQILVGKQKISQLIRQGAEMCSFEEFIDPNLEGNFSKTEAAALGKIALLCTHESPDSRMAIDDVVRELAEMRVG